MLNLTLKLRDDEVDTLFECISTAAKQYSRESLKAFTSGDTGAYMYAHEKKTYAWQLFDHIKHAVDRQREEG